MHIRINNSEYWVEESGQGPPILLLHGFTGSGKTWSDFIPLLDKDYRVIQLDLPGHGKTNTPSVLTMHEFCSELSSLLEVLDIDLISLIGYSLGGRTALSFACLFPEKVDLLVLESASPGIVSGKERIKRKQADEQLADWIVRNGTEGFVDYWESIPLFRTQQLLTKETQQNIRKERLSQRSEGLAASLKGMGTGVQPSWWGCLSHLSLPVLLLAGSEDEKFLAINKNMAEAMPKAEFFAVSAAGHCLHVEQPEIFGTMVYDFLSKHREKRRTEG